MEELSDAAILLLKFTLKYSGREEKVEGMGHK